MTVRSLAQLLADAETYLLDNTDRRISPSGIRERFKDLADSALQFTQSGSGAVERTVGDKAREVVSVTDFDADPDGVEDSAPAFAAALTKLALGGQLLVPPGLYRLESQVTITAPATRRLLISGYE